MCSRPQRDVPFHLHFTLLERFSYHLKIKTCQQNRNNKRKESERLGWYIEQIQTRVAFAWLSERSGEKTSRPRTLSRNQPILRFDVILQHNWLIEQCLLRISVFFGGKTKSSCFDLFIHSLKKQITNTYRNHFSRSYENHSIVLSLRLRLPRTAPDRLKIRAFSFSVHKE